MPGGSPRLDVVLPDLEGTLELGRRLGSLLRGGEVLALEGDLGSGKTTFTRAVVDGLGCETPGLVTSPTYVLEQVYPARVPVRHYDVYRLGDEEELLALGFEEHLGTESVAIVEWADRVGSCLPPSSLRISLGFWPDIGPGARRVVLTSADERWRGTLQELEKNG